MQAKSMLSRRLGSWSAVNRSEQHVEVALGYGQSLACAGSQDARC
jgi:hypothetical protein